MHTVFITFANGSSAAHSFKSFSAAQSFYREGISYSGGRVQRVVLRDPSGSERAIWDASWDALSKHEGLHR